MARRFENVMRTPHLITVTIKTNNAIFDDNEGAEVSRILRTCARDFTAGGQLLCGDWKLYENNGNLAGRIVIESCYDDDE